MRLAGTHHLEWGYLAPAPNLMRTARIFIVAAAMGATASGAVFCSLIYRPPAEASVAERTLVRVVDPIAGAGGTTVSSPPAQCEHCLVTEPRRADDAGVMPPACDAARTRARSGSPTRAEAGGSTPAEHASAAGSLAESPRIMTTESSAVRASGNEGTSASAVSEAAPPTLWKAPIKKSRAVARAAPQYGLYVAARYQSRYGARERGSYGLPYGSGLYGDRDYQ